jgi:hypothetical protein
MGVYIEDDSGLKMMGRFLWVVVKYENDTGKSIAEALRTGDYVMDAITKEAFDEMDRSIEMERVKLNKRLAVVE